VTIDIAWYVGRRAELRPLFALADDSGSQVDQYLELGRVLVARRAGVVIGHAQFVPTTDVGEIELKNMAVIGPERRAGVGRALVVSALRHYAEERWLRMIVATAAADTGTLRFYQRVGFRMVSVERDAYTPATGYPATMTVDGIPLLDRVWLAQDLTAG
jgi:GNAT superfamily N-acetyltransferase